MPAREILIVVTFLAVCLLGCGPTPAQVNNSGHGPYLNGDYTSALESYLDAQGRAPESGEPHYNSGNALYRTEEYEEALQSYDESLRRSGGELRARGFFNRGNTAFQQQNYPDAVEAYEEVLRMNPEDEDAKHNLELALSRMPPQDQEQQEEEQQEEEQQDEQQEEEEQDEEEQDEEEDEQEQDERDAEADEQDQPMTETQASQILESVGEAAQTLQERRGQVLVSPKPPSEFDW